MWGEGRCKDRLSVGAKGVCHTEPSKISSYKRMDSLIVVVNFRKESQDYDEIILDLVMVHFPCLSFPINMRLSPWPRLKRAIVLGIRHL